MTRDIGNPVLSGTASVANGTFTISGAGADIWDNSDQFRFVYQSVQGDVEVIARLSNLQSVDNWSKAGVMIRDSLTGGATHAYMFGSGSEGFHFQRRAATSGWSDHSWGPSGEAPRWIRLVREGSLFTAYESVDGSTWNVVGSDTVSMSNTIYVGLAVTSHDEYAHATATFTNVSVGLGSSQPSPWTGRDIGNPDVAGANVISGGTFAVTGAGVDIWDQWDQFYFVSQPVQGDIEIIAELGTLQQVDLWTKAGVMIRESLTGESKHAFMFGSGVNGWNFQRRVATWGSSDHTWGPWGGAPGWIRLVREGSLFSAYQSRDGSSWTLVGSDTIAMSQAVFAGLAVTSHVPWAAATAMFNNVLVRPYTQGANQSPTVSITNPSANATYSEPATITLAATAADTDGSISRIDFYAGSQIVASDTSAPFTQSWSNVPAGQYTVRAVATDNEGATASSTSVTVTVYPASIPQARPTTAIFVPSSDHNTNVTSYVVGIYRASDPVTASPSATRDLGKPSVVDGEISVNISTTLDPLPTGSYYAIVWAIGPGGTAASAPSPTFTK